MRMKKTIYILLTVLSVLGCRETGVVDGPHDPKVLSIIPKAGYPGTEATISGWYFEGKQVSVTIGGTPATVKASTMDRISVVMPEKTLGIYEVEVTVDGRSKGGIHFRYAEHPEEEKLAVFSYSPMHGYEGEQITIGGQLFSPKPEENTVTINDKPCLVTTATVSRLVVTLPDNPEGQYPFVVTVGGESVTGPMFTYDRKPDLTVLSIEPATGLVGEEITVKGLCFSPVPSENIVTLNGVRAEVLSASMKELRIKAPENPLGSYPVVVTVGDKTAEGPAFMYVSKKLKYTVRTVSGKAGRAADAVTVIDGGPSEVKYWQPRGLVFLPDGRMVIFDNGNNAFRFMDLTSYTVTSTQSAKSLLNAAWRGTLHGDWIYLASKGNNRLVRYNYKTDESEVVGADLQGGTSPMDVAFDAVGNGYVLIRDGVKGILQAPGGDFTALESFTTFTDGPLAMQFAPDGQLIVTTNGCQVISVAPNGIQTVIAGIRAAKADDNGQPGQPLTAKFGSNLFGMTVDGEGNIYVADDSFKIIKLIQKGSDGYANAIVSTIAGLSGQSGQSDGVGSDARFGTPGEIRMAPDDKHLYISEYSNFTIREITIE